jgi:DNA-directed RNA polymerase specialized sigma24 family protein
MSMNPRQASLLRLASSTERQIWANAHFGIRMAAVMKRLASDISRVFGSAVYTIFMRAGVDMLDDIGGIPAIEWIKQRKGRQCPENYPQAVKFGKRAYAMSLRYAGGDDSAVEEAMQETMVKVLQNPGNFLNIPSLPMAEQYVLKLLHNVGADQARRRGRNPEKAMGLPGQSPDGDDATAWMPRDPHELAQSLEWRQMLKRLERHETSIMRDLAKIHPGAGEYIKALIDNPRVKDSELIGDQQTDKPASLPGFIEKPVSKQYFNKAIKPRIMGVLRNYVEQVR